MQTARNCVLVGLWGENCKGEGSADCKKLCTGGIVGENCKGEGDFKKLCTDGRSH